MTKKRKGENVSPDSMGNRRSKDGKSPTSSSSMGDSNSEDNDGQTPKSSQSNKSQFS